VTAATLKVVPSSPSARDVLAEAIAERSERHDALAVAGRTLAQAQAGLDAAQSARAAVDLASHEGGVNLAARIRAAVMSGQAPAKPSAASKSALARASADENLAEAAAAVDVLTKEHAVADQAAKDADLTVRRASRAVLAEHAAAIAAAGSEAIATLDRANQNLVALGHAGFTPEPDGAKSFTFPPAAKPILGFDLLAGSRPPNAVRDLADRFRAWRGALEQDAYAEPPDGLAG
jgi:hypothetical protein